MRVLSWNVAGRADRLGAQVDAVLGREPDVVALQEVLPKTYAMWRESLLGAGYSVVSTIELAQLPYPPPPYPKRIKQAQIHRKNFNLTAARHPIAHLSGLRFDNSDHARLAFPEKFIAAEISLAGRQLEVHNAHAPPGSSRYVLKPQALAAVARRVDERPWLPRVLCGDFNTPPPEVEGERPETWAYRYPEVLEEWDAGERAILEHPHLHDAYKQVHRPGAPWPYSHRVKNSKIQKRRYDHIYVSEHFKVLGCNYLIEWLETDLSDHAAVESELALHE